jgi:T4 superinfection immunity protein
MSFYIDPQLLDAIASLTLSLGVALIVAGAVTLFTGRWLELPQDHKLWVFIVGFALLSSMSTTSMAADDPWTLAVLLHIIPVIAAVLYFIPTIAAISSYNPASQRIFLLNLVFGWTVIGWVVALKWSLEHTPEHEAAIAGYRYTPFGVASQHSEAEHKSPSTP